MRRKMTMFFLLIFSFIANGQTWERVGLAGERVVRVLPDPVSPDSIYAITVFGMIDPPEYILMRTIDGGARWERLSSRYCNATLHPATAETIFATMGIGSFSDGVWRSNDYGRTFDFPPPASLYMAKAVIYDPVDWRYMFAVGDGVIMRSMDAGVRWEEVFSFPGIVTVFNGIYVDPRANNRVYAWTDAGELYFSMDHGDRWERLAIFTESWTPYDIGISASDSSIIYVACWGGLAKSRDCGMSWELFRMPEAPTNRVVVSEYSSDIVLVGGTYGAMLSIDGGGSWARFGEGIEVFDIRKGTDGHGGFYWYFGTSDGIYRTDYDPSSRGPIVSRVFPRNGACVSLGDFDIIIGINDPDGIDRSSIELRVNGISYISGDPRLAIDDTSIVFDGVFIDGESYSVSLVSMSDMLGNPSDMLPYDFDFSVDRSAPRILHRFPGPGSMTPSTDITAKFYFEDIGCGIDTMSFEATFNSVRVTVASHAVLIDRDTFLVHLPTAGVILSPGDTVRVSVSISDRPTIGEINRTIDEWFFSVEPSAIDEVYLPEKTKTLSMPNPFNSACRIYVPDYIPSGINIFDIRGNLVKSFDKSDFNNCEVLWKPHESVPAGIYLLKGLDGSYLGKVHFIK